MDLKGCKSVYLGKILPGIGLQAPSFLIQKREFAVSKLGVGNPQGGRIPPLQISAGQIPRSIRVSQESVVRRHNYIPDCLIVNGEKR